MIFIPTTEYNNLTNGTKPTIDADTILVQELWPAMYDAVTPAALTSFLRDVLGLADDRAVYAYGSPERGA